jgi:hypothetical protein
MSVLWDLFSEMIGWPARKWATSLSKDYRDDPIYKQNLQRLIDHHRRVEDTKDV